VEIGEQGTGTPEMIRRIDKDIRPSRTCLQPFFLRDAKTRATVVPTATMRVASFKAFAVSSEIS